MNERLGKVAQDLRQSTFSRIAVAIYLVVTAGVGIVYFPRAVSQLGDRASSNNSLSFADREIAGGNSIIVDQEAAYEARALIPETGRYRVVTGSAVQGATELTGSFVDGWFKYFLMPRRPAHDALWVICYGCDRSGLGGTYEIRWRDDKGISIGWLR